MQPGAAKPSDLPSSALQALPAPERPSVGLKDSATDKEVHGWSTGVFSLSLLCL